MGIVVTFHENGGYDLQIPYITPLGIQYLEDDLFVVLDTNAATCNLKAVPPGVFVPLPTDPSELPTQRLPPAFCAQEARLEMCDHPTTIELLAIPSKAIIE